MAAAAAAAVARVASKSVVAAVVSRRPVPRQRNVSDVLERARPAGAAAAGRLRYHPVRGQGSSSSTSSSRHHRELRVQHILVDPSESDLLDSLHARIADGEDMGELAEEYSKCPSRKRGGDIGWIQWNQTMKDFQDAAWATRVGQLARVSSKHGVHLLRVNDEREPPVVGVMQVEELASVLDDEGNDGGDRQLIDVREPDEVAIASLPGFSILPLSRFSEWAPRILSDLDPNKETLVLCHHGVRSLQAANFLLSQGFNNVKNIEGGIHAYSTRVNSSVPVY